MKYKLPGILFIFLFIPFAIQAQDRHTIDSLKNEISISKSDTLTVGLLNVLAGEYKEIDKDSTIYYLNQALIIARDLDDPKYKARIYANLGGNYCFKGEYLKALEYLDLAENITKEYSFKNYQAYVHYIKSIVFISIDKLNLANEHATEALELYQELNQLSNVGDVYTIFSSIYEKLGDMQKSLMYAKKSYEISLQLNAPIDMSAAMNNLGTIYFQVNQIDSAYQYIRKAIKLSKKYNLQSWLAINYQNLSRYMLKEGKVDSADFYIQKSLEIYQEVGYLLDIYNTLSIKAEIALARTDTLKAMAIYQTIIDSPKHLENISIRTNAYKAMYQLSVSMGQYIEALDYFESYKLFDDSLKKETNTSLLSVLELQMEYENIRNHLQLENKEVKLKSQRKTLYLLLSTSIILLLFVIIFFIYRLQRSRTRATRIEQQRLKEELDFKNQEMTANVMALMKKNEILTEISKKLLEVEIHAEKDETKGAVRKIALEISKTRNVELWEEFDIRFKMVHHDFYDKLLMKFPNLSPAEQRLCAFLRMNMSTKDVAELTGLQILSINNSRSRIRNKMNLSTNDNLVSFLSKI